MDLRDLPMFVHDGKRYSGFRNPAQRLGEWDQAGVMCEVRPGVGISALFQNHRDFITDEQPIAGLKEYFKAILAQCPDLVPLSTLDEVRAYTNL